MSFSEKQKTEWKSKIIQQQNSKQSISKWCRENHTNLRKFHYWKSKLLNPKIDRSDFSELLNNNSIGISIEYRGAHIHLDKHFDIAILKNCLLILREIKC